MIKKKALSKIAPRVRSPATTQSIGIETWPKRASIFEVGPRDGLQSEDRILSIDDRAQLVSLMIEAGMQDIEVGSFVRADVLPQVAHTKELLKKLEKKNKGKISAARFWAFIPNDVGLSHGIESGISGASFFLAVSNTFCEKNVNRSRIELLKSLPSLLETAKKNKIASRVYLSTLVYCPYEGITPVKQVGQMVDRLVDMGADEIVLSDTTGDANPKSLSKVLDKVLAKYAAKKFALHLHDTRGLALANILQGMKFGISRFDSSVGGMGGCPYAPGASGNLATEDLLNMLLGMGINTGIDLGRVARAGFFAEECLQKKLPSRILRTLERSKK